MNRTMKEATVRTYHYDHNAQPREHLAAFLHACNFAQSPQTLSGLARIKPPLLPRRTPLLCGTEHLRAHPRKPYRPKTTRPDHAACPSLNLLAAATSPQVPGTHLVSDIT
jgi:hypothetical protein